MCYCEDVGKEGKKSFFERRIKKLLFLMWVQTGRIVRALPAAFVLLALPTCLFLSLFVPTGEVVDEPSHVLRAGSLLHGQLIGHRAMWKDADGNPIEGAGVIANPALLRASQSFPQGTASSMKKLSIAKLQAMHDIRWDAAARFVYAPNTAVYMPLFYIPVAFGLGLAHVWNFGPHAAILLGRLFNVACFVGIGLAALLLAERGRTILFVTLTLPMTLSLAASSNQDGLLIATSAFAAALLTRCRDSNGWPYWLSGIAIAVIAAAKPAYLPLAGLMLLPAQIHLRQGLSGVPWTALSAVVLTMMPGLVWAAFSAVDVAAPFVRGPAYHPGPLWPGDPNCLFHATNPTAQLSVFLNRPSLLLELPLAGLSREWGFRVRELVGVFGWIEFLLPASLYTLWYWAIPLSLLANATKSPGDTPRSPQLANMLLGLSAIVASIFALYDVQYLSWTPVGAALVDGVQGRYGLPILAFFGATLPVLGGGAIRGVAGLPTGVLALPAIAAAACGLVALPEFVIFTYYLR